jgi:flagellar protein FliO/FliZ
LGGEKLKPSIDYHACRIKFRLFFGVLVLMLSGAGRTGLVAQEPGEALGGGYAAEGAAPSAGSAPRAGAAPGASAPAEGEIYLGEESPGIPVAEPGPVSGFTILRTVLLLLLAVAAIYGLVYVVKRLSRPRDMLNPNLRILATTRLGPGRFIHAVALGNRAWLVGAGEGGISHIADITEQEALDTLFLEESRQNGASGRIGDFQSLLRRLGLRPPPAEAEDREDLAEKIRLRRDRLRGL